MQGFELLNCDDHGGFMRKHERDPALSRPDITHQLLLGNVNTVPWRRSGHLKLFYYVAALLDSPLNKAGLLQVYIETTKGILIEVSAHTRIPRTFKRFAGLMGEFGGTAAAMLRLCAHCSVVTLQCNCYTK
jgi:rRNA pseudouridine-1189 N-methylase Emg1 (Nep1/Mra1 family)